MTPKELIEQIKDYANCADASYAMLHFVEQNEKNDKQPKAKEILSIFKILNR